MYNHINFVKKAGEELLDGRNITALRKRRGMNQEELAHLLNTTIVTISRWENGHFEPKASVIKRLCEILDCTESELLNGPSRNKVEIVLSWNWEDMTKGEINMDENKFKLILGENGMVGLHGAGRITSRDAIEEFLSRVRNELEIAFDAQVRRGVIQES